MYRYGRTARRWKLVGPCLMAHRPAAGGVRRRGRWGRGYDDHHPGEGRDPDLQRRVPLVPR